MLVVGDFNFGNICWAGDGLAFEASSNDIHKDNAFIDMLNDAFLHQSVTEPTFQTVPGDLCGILDLIISENDDRVAELVHLPPLGALKKGHLVLS